MRYSCVRRPPRAATGWRAHAMPATPVAQLERVVDSIADANTYIVQNRKPVDRMIAYVKHFFHPDREERGWSLGIRWGSGGSKLSHQHRKDALLK